MDRLFDSLKISRAQASSSFNIFVFVIVICCLAAIFTLFIFLKNGGSMLQELQASFPSVAVNTVLYICAGTVMFMILVMLFNSQYEVYFQPKNIGINRNFPPYSTFWQTSKLENPHDPFNQMVLSDEFPMSRADVYTMSIELNIADTRAGEAQGPYRHILHRGTNELQNFTPNSPGSIPKGRGDLNDGLPLQMNPGVFIDQFTNDLVIFIDTDPVDHGNQAYRESLRVADIPVKTPFRLHITVHDQIAEVYINCKLATTKLLHGSPRAVPNDWYGRIGFARSQSIFQNMNLWDIDLYAIEISKMCPPIIMPTKGSPTSMKCGS
jgi:hypothetical protein